MVGFTLGRDRPRSARPWTSAVLTLTCAELALLAWNPLILYPRNPLRLEVLQSVLLSASAVCLLALVAHLSTRAAWVLDERAFWVGFVLLMACRVSVLAISPKPHIDVFASGTQGAQYLLQGLNPYAQTYPDIYRGAYGYKPAFFYGPFYLLWASGAWVLGDIRWGNLLAEGLTALGMLRLLRGAQWAGAGRWTILAWLAFPASLFMLEQAWVDSILLLAFVWMWLASGQQRATAAGIAAGLALGVKQTAVIGVLLTLVWTFRAGGRRAGFRFALAMAATVAIIYVPFLLWDAAAIWRSLVTVVLETPPRGDALTLGAWLLRAGGDFHVRALGWAGAAICLALVLWLARRRRDLMALTVASTLAYFVVFLCGFQAFCNYYWFVAGMLALTCVQQAAPRSECLPGAASG